MYFIASSFSEWLPIRRTGSDEIDSSAPKIHASWLNQIEIYFSILQRKALTPNDLRGGRPNLSDPVAALRAALAAGEAQAPGRADDAS